MSYVLLCVALMIGNTRDKVECLEYMVGKEQLLSSGNDGLLVAWNMQTQRKQVGAVHFDHCCLHQFYPLPLLQQYMHYCANVDDRGHDIGMHLFGA